MWRNAVTHCVEVRLYFVVGIKMSTGCTFVVTASVFILR